MKPQPLIFLLALFFFLDFNVHAQGDSVRISPIEFDGAINNPLKGFRYNKSGIGNYPYDAIARTYIKWNELERNNSDGLDRVLQVSNQKWSGLAGNNTKVIPRVYLDWDSKTGNEYWPSDMQTGDYSSDQFKQRLEDLIIKMGKAWDNDSRVAWVQMGIIGYWGEHHHPAPNDWQQKLMGDLFSEAFQNKKVLIRRPWETFEEYNFGWYWDSFAHWDQISSQANPMLENCPDRWKTEPIEGEVAYNWGNYEIQPGSSPSVTLKDPGHRKWLMNYIRKLHCTGLGWVSDYDRYNSEVAAGAEEVQKIFGYRYLLKEVIYPGTIQNNQSFSISFDVENVGSAPFYYDWPIELRLLDPETHAVKWKKVFKNVDIRDWMPGDNWNPTLQKYNIQAPVIRNTASFNIDSSLPKGKYILALAILDPAGMVPSARFATSQYFKGGVHPIGYIGIDTTLEDNTLDPADFDDPAQDNSLSYEVRSSYQEPYGESSLNIPGKIEAEHYDKGGEGVAYHDDQLKEGDTDLRPEDKVDILSRADASNGSVVSFTEEGEWLEYTAEVIAGEYDITLYYYCGETPGDLEVSLDGKVIDTISGLQNQGWDKRDSITIEDVLIQDGGKKKILQLEFINSAGFDIDAIKFTRLSAPITGVSLSGCPTDSVILGYQFQLSGSTIPTYADDPALIWESSDEQVATVDSLGTITSLNEGTTTITATTREGGFSAECELRFYVTKIPVYGVTIGGCPGYVLITGDSLQLEALVAPPDAYDTGVSWTSSNPEVAAIDSTGLIKALSQGTTKITITTNDGGFNSSCNIGVMADNSSESQGMNTPLAEVYPNPASDRIYIKFPQGGNEWKVNIYDMYGKSLWSGYSFESLLEIDTREFISEAMLIVEVVTAGEAGKFKVMLSHR